MAAPTFFTNRMPSVVAIVMVFIIIGAMGYIFMNMPDNRTSSEKMSDAAAKLSGGVSGAAKTLGNQTPADRARDDVEKIGDKARDIAN